MRRREIPSGAAGFPERIGKIVTERLDSTMKRVITYGTFDLLHYGHINLLRRARELGDYLIVALSTDDSTGTASTKPAIFPMKSANSCWRLSGTWIW